MSKSFAVSANIVNVIRGSISTGTIVVENGRIREIRYENLTAAPTTYVLPGFVDAHVHIESSMLVPTEFARLATVHGTVATVSDPHEIANVLGADGVFYMLDNAALTPLKIFFGAPSCVPATPFDKAGGLIGAAGVGRLLDDPRIKYLTEMMNFPGVLMDDPEVSAKLAAAKQRNKPIDGHAPGVRGDDLTKYIQAGISTDHESRTFAEGLEKLQKGMKLIIREGSAAKDFKALHLLMRQFPDACMFCSDDKHPNDLVEGHINQLVSRAVSSGIDTMTALRVACVTPVRHYRLEVGLLNVGDPADFIEVSDLEKFNVLRTWIDGELVAEHGKPLLPRTMPKIANNFRASRRGPESFRVDAKGISGKKIKVVEAIDGQLVTNCLIEQPKIEDDEIVSDVSRDLLKMVLVDRYNDGPAAVCFVKNFGLNRGAIASTVSHDSHNVIAVGANDHDLATSINALIEVKGGISVASHLDTTIEVLPLPIAGLMSDQDGYQVAEAYSRIDAAAKALGSELTAPFMTLSFMALTVIPALKLGPYGLFDVNQFKYVPLAD